MLNFKNLLLLFTIGALGAITTAAQPAAPGFLNANPATSANFTSLDAGFSIDLPRQFSSYQSMPASPGAFRGGSIYSWKLPDETYTVGVMLPVYTPQQADSVVNAFVNTWAAKSDQDPTRIVERKPITLMGVKGIDLWVKYSGIQSVTRFFLLNERLFFLSTGWPVKEDGAREMRVINSFKLIDVKSILERSIVDATPPALPQSPVVKRVGNDAADEGLIGPVKTVTMSREDLEPNAFPSGILIKDRNEYNSAGLLTRNVWYNYRGHPINVTVYGFIDGRRVSLRGPWISYEYDPPPMIMRPGAAAAPVEQKAADDRYSTRYEFKYDGQSRLIERAQYSSRGEINSRRTYTYDGRQVTVKNFDRLGLETGGAVNIYDERGNLMRSDFPPSPPDKPDAGQYIYKYLETDAHGNWTKREVTGRSAKSRGGTVPTHFFDYRTISYY